MERSCWRRATDWSSRSGKRPALFETIGQTLNRVHAGLEAYSESVSLYPGQQHPQRAVANGDSVSLIGFGTFKASARAAREGKNPKTGEKLSIAATTVPKFSAGTNFKAAVAKK